MEFHLNNYKMTKTAKHTHKLLAMNTTVLHLESGTCGLFCGKDNRIHNVGHTQTHTHTRMHTDSPSSPTVPDMMEELV